MLMNQLRALSFVELNKKLQELRGQLFVLRFQIYSGKSNKFSQVPLLRRDIARILTILGEMKKKKKTQLDEKKKKNSQKTIVSSKK